MTPFWYIAVSYTITCLLSVALVWDAILKLTRWSLPSFLLLWCIGLGSQHRAQVRRALWQLTAAEGSLVPSTWLSYCISLKRGEWLKKQRANNMIPLAYHMVRLTPAKFRHLFQQLVGSIYWGSFKLHERQGLRILVNTEFPVLS